MSKRSVSLSDECDSALAVQIEENFLDVIADLKDLHNDMQKDLLRNHYDQDSKPYKINKIKTRLELIDNKLLGINNMLNPNPSKLDDLVSNFGMSLKVDNAKSKLNETIKRHESLRKEWYSQEEHVTRLASEVESKDDQLQLQSIYCTTQGLILSKMLWKASNYNNLLDMIITNSKLALELVKTLDGCLYAFTQTYYDEMPEPSAEEYQYVLCLCGIVSNIASVPDGRFLLISQPVCKDVFDQIIDILPNILVPKAEALKWIMLTAIHNLMICKEGEEYARHNEHLLKSLSECISAQHSNKIIVLALKIMSSLANEITNKSYMTHICRYLPIKRLEELRQSRNSLIVRKQARSILSAVIRSSRYYENMEREELVHTTRLDGSRSRTRITGTQTSTNKRTPEVLAYYVITDQSTTNTSSSSDQSRETETLTGGSEISTELTPAEDSGTMNTSHSFPVSKFSIRRHAPHSAPASSIRRQSALRPSSPVPYSSRQFVNEDSSTLLEQEEARRRYNIETNYPVNEQFNNQTESNLCRPSTMSVPEEAFNLNRQLENLTSSISDDVQTLQCQIPQLNLNKFFSITIGDNLQNTNRNSVATTYADEQNTGSIVTVFRISKSKALLTSDNSFNPFYSTISTNTSLPWEAMNNFFKTAAKNAANKKSVAVAVADNNDAFDIAYGGYGSYFEKLQYVENEKPHGRLMLEPRPSPYLDGLNLPSTSAGYFGYEERPSVGVTNRHVSSTSSLVVEQQSDQANLKKKAKSERKNNSEKRSCSTKSVQCTEDKSSTNEVVSTKKEEKKKNKKKGSLYRIFEYGKKW